jgi:hypothetical protein
MSMTAAFVAIPATKLGELKEDPELVGEFFFERLESGDEDTVLDIDKSWQGIHFLLTGDPYNGAEPQSLPILGGTEIGSELSYGPARYLEPAQVEAAARVLADVVVEQLRQRYKPKELEIARIYPNGFWMKERDQAFEYLAQWYERLQGFYAAAAQRGDAMLLAIV